MENNTKQIENNGKNTIDKLLEIKFNDKDYLELAMNMDDNNKADCVGPTDCPDCADCGIN